MPLAASTRLGPYEILGLIAAGGMGEVYTARDPRLDRIVAIKVLPSDAAFDGERRARFEREAKAIAGLSHPYICTLYDVGETAGSMFLVMEHLSGETLGTRLRRGPLPLDQTLTTAIEIASALDAAHAHGVIHRDLKPGNVMLTSTGVKLLDFGVAKLRSEAESGAMDSTNAPRTVVTATGQMIGTAGYMSPEQVKGEPLDSRTDLFSLGVLIYEMATGERPFKGDSMERRLASILFETPQPVTSIDERLPQELDRILRHALAKDPDRRYQTARDFRNDLEELKGQTGTAAGAVAVPAQSNGRRRATITILGTLVAAAVMAGVWTSGWFRPRPSMDRRSIAVLPLKNLSADPENEYFSDGIGEDIITALSKLGDLRVIAATSSAHYKNSTKTVPEIGRELSVETLLEGSVRRVGKRVRIVSELVDTRTQQQLWGETYDRDLEDIFAIQTEVSRRIAEALKGELSPAEQARLESRPVANVDAYSLYLKGRHYWNQRSGEGISKAVDYFEQAIAKEPRYALAYAGLADSYALLGQYGVRPATEMRPLAKEAATKALALDDTLAEAHASQALVEHSDFGWLAAGEQFRRALELNPNYATAHHWFANYLAQLGRFDEAVAEIRRARTLDPLSIGIATAYGAVLYLARRYDEAAGQLKKALEMEPSFALGHVALAEVYIQTHDYEKALKEYDTVSALIGSTAEARASIAYIYAAKGEHDTARRL